MLISMSVAQGHTSGPPSEIIAQVRHLVELEICYLPGKSGFAKNGGLAAIPAVIKWGYFNPNHATIVPAYDPPTNNHFLHFSPLFVGSLTF